MQPILLCCTPAHFITAPGALSTITRRAILRKLYLQASRGFAILDSAAEAAAKHAEEAITMAEVEKLKDEALNEVSGGQKYNVGNIPISVHPYPN